MAEAFAIAAGVVSVVAPALHATREVLDDFRKISSAPNALASIRADVQAFQSSLKLVEKIDETLWDTLGDKVAALTKAAINRCASVCRDVHDDLRRWTRSEGDDGMLTWRGRVTVGFFKERRLKTLSEQLQNCKLALTEAVGVANLYSSVHGNSLTAEVRQDIFAQQSRLVSTAETTDTQLAQICTTLGHMKFTDCPIANDRREEIEQREDFP